jgi:hypothetical protein
LVYTVVGAALCATSQCSHHTAAERRRPSIAQHCAWLVLLLLLVCTPLLVRLCVQPLNVHITQQPSGAVQPSRSTVGGWCCCCCWFARGSVCDLSMFPSYSSRAAPSSHCAARWVLSFCCCCFAARLIELQAPFDIDLVGVPEPVTSLFAFSLGFFASIFSSLFFARLLSTNPESFDDSMYSRAAPATLLMCAFIEKKKPKKICLADPSHLTYLYSGSST